MTVNKTLQTVAVVASLTAATSGIAVADNSPMAALCDKSNGVECGSSPTNAAAPPSRDGRSGDQIEPEAMRQRVIFALMLMLGGAKGDASALSMQGLGRP